MEPRDLQVSVSKQHKVPGTNQWFIRKAEGAATGLLGAMAERLNRIATARLTNSVYELATEDTAAPPWRQCRHESYVVIKISVLTECFRCHEKVPSPSTIAI